MPDTALITGASSGIGEDLARLIAAGGSTVARAGYDAMMNGTAIVVPGLVNKIGVQSLRA